MKRPRPANTESPIPRNLSDPARLALAIANQFAWQRGCASITPELILLAMLRRLEGGAAVLIRGTDVDAMCREADGLVGPDPTPSHAGKLPMTAASRDVLNYAAAEARARHEDYCLTLKKLTHVLICSECMAYGEMVVIRDDPKQRVAECRCRNCKHSWRDDPVFAGQRKGHRQAKLNNRIRREYDRIGDIATVARILGVEEAEVQKALDRPRRARSQARFNTRDAIAASA